MSWDLTVLLSRANPQDEWAADFPLVVAQHTNPSLVSCSARARKSESLPCDLQQRDVCVPSSLGPALLSKISKLVNLQNLAQMMIQDCSSNPVSNASY